MEKMITVMIPYLALSFFLRLLFLFTDDILVLLIVQCYHTITHSLSSQLLLHLMSLLDN